MTTEWHGYFVVERQNIGSGNWDALRLLFEAMGTSGSDFPAYNNHKRIRLDDNAVIYESNFDTSEVSIPAFKQLLADEFGVNVEDIETEISDENYAGYGTTVWQFIYPISGQNRFKVERFGGGNEWNISRLETVGYIAWYSEEWEPGE